MSARTSPAPLGRITPPASDLPAGEPARALASSTFEQYHDELYRSALRACRDPETAEDLVQEALLRLMVEVDTRGAPRNARAWLHRVIANLAVSLGRRSTVSRRHASALVNREEPATPEGIMLEDEARSTLASALQTLPRKARTALLLAASGYRGAEIAAMIGSSDCATRTMMSRARLKLRDQVAA
ncbi:MAG: RNA polymerase sigma factor [Chloroflexi bacterium]|nr:RNA polymerase sigma factor [Chloroflexota bacterium]